jgi:hypothetical protein
VKAREELTRGLEAPRVDDVARDDDQVGARVVEDLDGSPFARAEAVRVQVRQVRDHEG